MIWSYGISCGLLGFFLGILAGCGLCVLAVLDMMGEG